MKNLFTIAVLFIGISNSSCQEKKEPTSKNAVSSVQTIQVERSFLFKSYSTEKLMVAHFVEDYLNIMYDSSKEHRNSYWDSKILTDSQDFFLKGGFEKGFLLYNSPQILGIRALDKRQYEVKLAIEQDGTVFKIMNLVVAFDGLDRPYFIDQLGENLKTFDKKTIGNIEFLYSQKVTQNDSLEQKMVDFNNKTAIFFEKPTKKPKVIVLKDLKDYCNVLGYDYMPFLTYDVQTGGIAMPQENILFSANNSPYYPHELVHLYTADYDPHWWFNEGCATYLGGSVEYDLKHHLKKIANQMDSLNFSNLPEDKRLDDDTNFKYAIGGLFCKLAIEEYGGKKSLLKLLNSGKTEEDFHAALKDVFDIEIKDYDSFIREALEKYKKKE